MDILRSETEIINSWKENSDFPLVSICCITFNHERYIEDTLKGFLTQNTNFSFEILIHDDASTDCTADIIHKYRDRYPKLIKPIIQTENQYSKGKRPNVEFNYPRARGKYIALCEGDDYWIDPMKLQKQVEFLEKNKDFIATYHDVQIIDENNIEKNLKLNIYNFDTNIFTKKDIENNKLPGQLGSVVYRNIWKELNEEIKMEYKRLNVSGDRKLALLLVLNGKIYRFEEKMSAYRRVVNSGISWSAKNLHKNLAFKRYNDLLQLEWFVTSVYNVYIDFEQERLNTFYSGVIFFLKKPNRKNMKVIKNIINLKRDKLFKLISWFILRLLSSPIRKIKGRLRI